MAPATTLGHNRPVRVLLIEDEIDLAEAVATGLRAEGFDVDVSRDGLDGLWRAQEHDYAAILLDIMLPGMNGYRICAALRESGNDTPILMLTAKSGDHDLAEALDTGADDYLSKPFSFVVLVARLRALLRRGGPRRAPALRAGALLLDPATRACHVDDHAVDLTPREFALLEHLLQHLGVVVSRRDLLNDIWGPDYPADSNVVDVYVRYLRKKIDEPFGRSSIETIRGVGYRLRDDR
jgi:two-component system OmpR family response regulator